MKYVQASGIICLFLIMITPACVKNTGGTGYTGSKTSSTMTMSKSIVKKGEPLLVSTTKPDVNSIIKWKIYPTNNTVILPADNQAAIFINHAGAHQVTANYYLQSDTTIAYDSSNSTIIVNDSTYTPPPVADNYDTASIAGDQITLIPTSSLDSGLVILANTTILYNCYPYLTAYGWTQGGIGSSLNFDFRSVEVVEGKGDCGGKKNQAYAYMPINMLAAGVYTVTANLNQVNYQGSLTVTDTDYTFSWNYTSGIVIFPLKIKKN
jgi:hypothetical protein